MKLSDIEIGILAEWMREALDRTVAREDILAALFDKGPKPYKLTDVRALVERLRKEFRCICNKRRITYKQHSITITNYSRVYTIQYVTEEPWEYE